MDSEDLAQYAHFLLAFRLKEHQLETGAIERLTTAHKTAVYRVRRYFNWQRPCHRQAPRAEISECDWLAHRRVDRERD